jgi:hypothetical protein
MEGYCWLLINRIYDPVRDTVYTPYTTVSAYVRAAIMIENDSSYYFSHEGIGIAYFIDTMQTIIDDSMIINNDEITKLSLMNNRLTALTRNHLLYQYDGSNWQLHPNNNDAQQVAADILYQDQGGAWLAGAQNSGIVRPLGHGHDIALKKIALASNQITAIHQKSNNEVWVLAANEIGLYNTSMNVFTEVDSLPITYSSAGGITIWNGQTVVATYGGLFRYNGTSWSALNITGLATAGLSKVTADSSGNLYVSGPNGFL